MRNARDLVILHFGKEVLDHETEAQIAFALQQHESGTPVAEIVRKMGIAEQTFYRWKRNFAGMGVAEVRRLKQLEETRKKQRGLPAQSPQVFVHIGVPEEGLEPSLP